MSAGPWKGPSKAHMRRTLEAARAAGIDIASIEATKDGTIRIVPRGATRPTTIEGEVTEVIL